MLRRSEPGPGPAMPRTRTQRTVVAGLDAGHDSIAEADLWLHQLVALLAHPDGVLACTHLIGQPRPHVAVSLMVPPATRVWQRVLEAAPAIVILSDRDTPTIPAVPAGARTADLLPGATLAARAAATRSDGRAVIFPGVDRLTGSVTVGEILAVSAVDRVTVLGGGTPEGDQIVDTRDHVRPVWQAGRLTLVTQPARGGRLVPFEHPSPTPCCADHR